MCARHCEARGSPRVVARLDSTVCAAGTPDDSHLCCDGGAEENDRPGITIIPTIISFARLLSDLSADFVVLWFHRLCVHCVRTSPAD